MRFSAGLALLLSACLPVPAQTPTLDVRSAVSQSDRLTYDVEWRLIHAGTVVIATDKSHASLELESAGIVSTLMKIHDVYRVDYDDPFCATSAVMDSQEGKRHHETKITYDRADNRATYLERDLIKNAVLHSDETGIPNCVQEVVGAFLKLRAMTVEPGQSAQIPMSDGRKSANVKIEAQEREEVKTPVGPFNTIRFEANMLNGVIYARKGRAFIWLTDDARHLPVQIRLRMQFPIGTVTLQLAREEHP
jgi:Protein of unknown function (DUF3108)